MMKRFFAPVLIALATLTQNASALVGGPFDNGYNSAQMEAGGVYQAFLTFRNGNGFCYFSPTANFATDFGTQAAPVANRGKINNRAVLYYKGITYIGSAIGTADREVGYIQCSINASSELTNANANGSGGNTSASGLGIALNLAGGGNFQGGSSTGSGGNPTTVISSARGFTMNGNWEAKVKRAAPTMRFAGKGELVFLSPAGSDAIAGLALSAYSGLINAIINAVGNAGQTVGADIPPGLFIDAQNSIDSLLDALPGRLVGAGLDATKDNGDIVKVKVRGTFRYL